MRKYGIGLKLQACVATVLTVETGKRTVGLLILRPIPIPTYTGEYWPIPDTGIGLTLYILYVSSFNNCHLNTCNIYFLEAG